MGRAVCLRAWSTNQNKALTGATIFMRGCLCAVLPAPAPFSSLFNHCLFTLSQELNEPWLRALPGKRWKHPPYPAFHPRPPPTHTLFYTASPNNNPTPAHSALAHKHITFHLKPQVKPWERVLLLSASYLLWLDHSNAGALSAVLKSGCTRVLSAAADLVKLVAIVTGCTDIFRRAHT